ncbi:MAG: nickel-dependent lactate racemase [Candidatus Latescibacteria bacterium]|nr:nickel-dependent lactate racemase [Candidatus Latescibacterota bacterium]
MRIQLDYGKDGLPIDLPDSLHIDVLNLSCPPPLPDATSAVEQSLNHPITSPPLADLAKGRRSACIVISDITRPVPNGVILPPMLRTLEACGIPRDRITILVGTGLHRPNEGDELVEMLGPEIAQRYRIVNHRARERDTHAYLGQTASGAPIWVDKTYLEADLRIATALIEPHLMAGYSGGRKAICPGICGADTIRAFHGFSILSHERATEGVLEGNPVHAFSLEVAKKARVDFILNVTMDEARRVTGVFAGDLEEAHQAGVTSARGQALALVPEPVDLVVTTSAGHPLDLTFYQAVKGMTAALPIVRDGGTILIAARCAEGLGSREFQDLLTHTESADAFFEAAAAPGFFTIDQWQIQELCKVLRRAKVQLYSEGIPEGARGRILVDLVPSVEDGVTQALAEYGPEARIVVIPKGPYVLPRVGEAVSA